MSSYDARLEAPYERRAAIEHDIERVEEEIWNADTPLSVALRLVTEAVPAPLTERLDALVSDWAELIVSEGYQL
jgi:hypothetical protein